MPVLNLLSPALPLQTEQVETLNTAMHDELVLEVAPEAMDTTRNLVVETTRNLVVETMENAIKLSVPLMVETGSSSDWMETK